MEAKLPSFPEVHDKISRKGHYRNTCSCSFESISMYDFRKFNLLATNFFSFKF